MNNRDYMKKAILITVIAGLLVAGYVIYPIVFERAKAETLEGAKAGAPPQVPLTITRAAKAPVMTGELKEGRPMQAYPTSNEFLGVETFRKISYEAFITIEVEDVRGTAFQVISKASELGGYVYTSEVSSDYASVVVKVPADSLWDALNYYRRLGKVLQERLNAKDVTERILDLEARIRNAEAQEKRLLELYSKASDVKDMLTIEDRLSAVREKIERLKAMKKALENMVDYSTIHVELRKPGKHVEPSDIEKLLGDAYKAFMGSIYIIVIVVAALLPVLIIGALIYVAYRLSRRGQLA